MKCRIVTDGDKWKIQQKGFLFWRDVRCWDDNYDGTGSECEWYTAYYPSWEEAVGGCYKRFGYSVDLKRPWVTALGPLPMKED